MNLPEKFIVVRIFVSLYIGETIGKAKSILKDPVKMAELHSRYKLAWWIIGSIIYFIKIIRSWWI